MLEIVKSEAFRTMAWRETDAHGREDRELASRLTYRLVFLADKRVVEKLTPILRNFGYKLFERSHTAPHQVDARRNVQQVIAVRDRAFRHDPLSGVSSTARLIVLPDSADEALLTAVIAALPALFVASDSSGPTMLNVGHDGRVTVVVEDHQRTTVAARYKIRKSGPPLLWTPAAVSKSLRS
jgi:hypothetical protein